MTSTVTAKRCAKCGESKPLSAFNYDRRRKDGRRGRCNHCRAHPNERAADRQRRTGFGKELFEALLVKQQFRCAICLCDIDHGASADHSHISQVPRGILCRGCNVALGILKDDAETLARAIRYLQQPPGTAPLIYFSERREAVLRERAINSGLIKIP